MIWPLPIAPWDVLVIQMKAGQEAQDRLAAEIVERLESAGVEVLWDDRPKVSPGIKFKDADLIGIPLRIVVGREAEAGRVEWKPRDGALGGEPGSLAAAEAVPRVLELVRAARSGQPAGEPAAAG